jgi:hypothetical protein
MRGVDRLGAKTRAARFLIHSIGYDAAAASYQELRTDQVPHGRSRAREILSPLTRRGADGLLLGRSGEPRFKTYVAGMSIQRPQHFSMECTPFARDDWHGRILWHGRVLTSPDNSESGLAIHRLSRRRQARQRPVQQFAFGPSPTQARPSCGVVPRTDQQA